MPCNRARAAAILGQHRLDALVTSSQANLTYLLNYPPMSSCMSEATVFAVLPANPDEDIWLVASRNSASLIVEWAPEVKDVWLWGTYHVGFPDDVQVDRLPDLPQRHARMLREAKSVPTALDGLRQGLKARGLPGGRIGFDEKGLSSPRFYDQVVAALPGTEVVMANGLFRRIRMIKTPEEIARMERAAQINDEAWLAAAKGLRLGASENDLAEVYRSTVRRLGAMPVYVSVNGGARGSLASAEASPYVFEPGDGIRFDLNLTYRNYFADTARTACLGVPPEKLRRYHAALAEGFDRAEAEIRPGARASRLFHICQEAVRAAGMPDFKRNHVGHGIGVECYDLPLIGPMDDTPLEEGMVINLENPVYEVGFGSVHLEDTYVVTAGGCRRFARTSRDLFVA
jgi:Xaa-Pro aminopeptidase